MSSGRVNKKLDTVALNEAYRRAMLQPNEPIDPILYQVILHDYPGSDSDGIPPRKIWKQVSKKTEGAVQGGELTGFYELEGRPDVKVFFKQDPAFEKNPGEKIASDVMKEFAKELKKQAPHDSSFDESSVTDIYLAYTSSDQEPNRNGNNVYVASVIYPNFLELYRDAYLAFHYLDQYQPLRDAYPEYLNRPFLSERPKLMDNDPVVELMISTGRYKGLQPLRGLRNAIDDPDVHFGNWGAVPMPKATQKCVQVDADGKMTEVADPNSPKPEGTKRYNVFSDVKTVAIDLGAAFGDDRLLKRTYADNSINRGILSTILRYHPSKAGPPPYEQKIPELVRNDSSAVFWLDKIAKIGPEKAQIAFNNGVAASFAKYDREVMLDFARMSGMKLKDADYLMSEDDFREKLVNYLSECFVWFQQSAQEYKENFVKKFPAAAPAVEGVQAPVAAIPVDKAFAENYERRRQADKIRRKYLRKIELLLLDLYETDTTKLLEEKSKQYSDQLARLIELRGRIIRATDDVLISRDFLQGTIKSGIFSFAIIMEKEKTPDYQDVPEAFVTYNASRRALKADMKIPQHHETMYVMLKLANTLDKTLSTKSAYHTVYPDLYHKAMQYIFKKDVDAFIAKAHKDTFEENEPRLDAVNAFIEAMDALMEYDKALANCQHESLDLKKGGRVLLLLKIRELDELLNSFNENLTAQAYKNLTKQFQYSTERMRKSTILVTSVTELNTTCNDNNREVFDNSLDAAAEKMYEESGKLAAQYLQEHEPAIRDLALLTETVSLTTQALEDPLSANARQLHINSKELDGKPGIAKRVGGAALMVVGALAAIAATVLLIASIPLIIPSFGSSLFGLPLAWVLLGAGVTAFTAGSSLLFSSRHKGTSKSASMVAKAVDPIQATDRKEQRANANAKAESAAKAEAERVAKAAADLAAKAQAESDAKAAADQLEKAQVDAKLIANMDKSPAMRERADSVSSSSSIGQESSDLEQTRPRARSDASIPPRPKSH
jgi:hypothetical protein